MNLYCAACDRNHRVTQGDAERLVYTLQVAPPLPSLEPCFLPLLSRGLLRRDPGDGLVAVDAMVDRRVARRRLRENGTTA